MPHSEDRRHFKMLETSYHIRAGQLLAHPVSETKGQNSSNIRLLEFLNIEVLHIHIHKYVL